MIHEMNSIDRRSKGAVVRAVCLARIIGPCVNLTEGIADSFIGMMDRLGWARWTYGRGTLTVKTGDEKAGVKLSQKDISYLLDAWARCNPLPATKTEPVSEAAADESLMPVLPQSRVGSPGVGGSD